MKSHQRSTSPCDTARTRHGVLASVLMVTLLPGCGLSGLYQPGPLLQMSSETEQRSKFGVPGFQTLGRTEAVKTVVVQRDDTLFSIANQHDVSIERLVHMNNLLSPQIRTGQILRLPGRRIALQHSPATPSKGTTS